MTLPVYQHLKLELKQTSNIIYLSIDKQNSSVNIIDAELLQELQSCFAYIKTELKPKALIIQSGKASGFIAGADIKQFTLVQSAAEATELISYGQSVLDDLHALPCTTIALVDGFCVGGGYELALACNCIIAVDNNKTKLGLPEVMLGIHPGFGGSIRLLQRIGSLKGLELIIAGKVVNAATAKKLGMVDALVKNYHIDNCVQNFIMHPPQPINKPWYEKLILLDYVRPIVGKLLNKKLASKINRQHYPAPFAVIDNWVECDPNAQHAYTKEADSVGQLMVTPSAQNLVRTFFLRDKLKALGKQAKFAGRHVHVKGAGVMGGDIAAWCALNGYLVTLEDTYLPAIAHALQRARTLFLKVLAVPHLVQAACDRLQADVAGQGVSTADIIIEAVVEDLEVKQQCFLALEAQAKPSAILATNTSTFPLAKIAAKLTHPDRVIGIHFFNPVAKMQLVEVVTGPNTAQDLIKQALAFVLTLDKLPLPVTSTPGFLVNRILLPYLLESVTLLEEGVPAAVIDQAALDFGMPMGPIELADTVGLDICKAAANILGYTVPTVVENLITQGKLGKKTAGGFYTYKQGKKLASDNIDNSIIPPDTTDRLINAILINAEQCLVDQVVAESDLVDAGMIFGAGFAPFRGGPLQYKLQYKQSKGN